MKNLLRKLTSALVLVFLSPLCFAQEEVQMADAMRANGKIYVIVAIILIVLLGLIAYLFVLDRKVKKLENMLEERNGKSVRLRFLIASKQHLQFVITESTDSLKAILTSDELAQIAFHCISSNPGQNANLNLAMALLVEPQNLSYFDHRDCLVSHECWGWFSSQRQHFLAFKTTC
jgi:hypothetical protein